jgi:Transposase.
MATVFWYSQDVIYIDFLEKDKMVTGYYYAKLLGRFHAELQKKQPHFAKKKCSSTMTMHRLTPPLSPWPN